MTITRTVLLIVAIAVLAAALYVGGAWLRLYGRHLAPPSPHLAQRAGEIEEGGFEADIGEMKKKNADELRELYKARDIEPQ